MKKLESFCNSFKYLPIVAVLASFVSCRSIRTVEQVPVYVHDTTYSYKELHDSIHIDRWHTEYQKGDTIYITNEVTKFKLVTKTDTAYRYIERPVEVEKEQIKEVDKPLSWWQQTQIRGFWLLLALLAVAIMVVVRTKTRR